MQTLHTTHTRTAHWNIAHWMMCPQYANNVQCTLPTPRTAHWDIARWILCTQACTQCVVHTIICAQYTHNVQCTLPSGPALHTEILRVAQWISTQCALHKMHTSNWGIAQYANWVAHWKMCTQYRVNCTLLANILHPLHLTSLDSGNYQMNITHKSWYKLFHWMHTAHSALLL